LTFYHETIEKPPELSSETTENGRFYTTPDGNVYPSVTTVLGRVSDKTRLKEWRDRVGNAEADKILRQAGRRGTAFHDLCEEYLKNNPDYKKGHMPANIASFNHIKPFLDKNVTSIGGLELPLYSDKLRVAGRVDLLCKWRGEWAIADFKTSRRDKGREDIHDYFMQAACYSYMVFERINILPKKIVIIMTLDDTQPKVFEERSKDWLGKFVECRKIVDI
jgi:ATP-dependent exoDNAse (exonuclease V) beta subunit